jgi:hypothetical protein
MRAIVPLTFALVLLVPACLRAADEPAADGFVSIFNGKDLTGWEGNPKLWSVKDGAITGQTTPENKITRNTFIIWKGGKLTDFELRLKFKMQGGNSGVQYRSKDRGDFVVAGYQADIDAANTYTGILYEEGGRGFIANLGQRVIVGADGKIKVVEKIAEPKDIRAAVKQGDWNEYVIVARGNHITQTINGVKTVDVTDEHEAKRSLEGRRGRRARLPGSIARRIPVLGNESLP